MRRYSVETDPETTARAYGSGLPISRKHAVELCRSIKNMMLQDAKDFLEDVVEMRRAVKFRKYRGGVGHRKGMGPGAYPVKAAKHMLKLLNEVENNADLKGLNTDALRIVHISAYNGEVWEGWMPRAHGRSTPKRRESVNVEVVVQEVEA